MKRLASLVICAIIAGSTGIALAQNTAASSPAAQPPMVNAGHPRIREIRVRMMEQMKRIHEGIKSGKLSKGEAQALRAKVEAVRDQMKSDIQQNGKKELTEGQLQQLNQMLDDSSKAIYGEKHDGDSTAPSSSSEAPAGK